jgi:hypothetical protein
MPGFYFDKEDGTGQDNNGSAEGQEETGQSELSELSKKFDNLYKHVSKMTSEIGDVKQTGTSIAEMQETLGSFAEQFQTIQERLPQNNDNDNEYDPYDRDKTVELLSTIVRKELEPIMEKQSGYITQDAFADLIGQAQKNAALKTEFKLTDEELGNITEEAEKNKVSVRELAYDKYGERVFKKTFNKELSDEFKKNDIEPPPDTDSESHFNKLGIPSDPHEFMRLHREKGSDEMKKLLMTKKE